MESTSMGHAYFAATNPEEQTDILKEFKAHDPARFPEVERTLRAAQQEYDEKGFCTSVGTWEDDVNAVGAAVELSNDVLAAFNCGGPATRITEESLPDLGVRLADLARHFQTADWVGQLPPRPYRGVQTT